jgi:DNA-binding MarR family transcriptional regulator
MPQATNQRSSSAPLVDEAWAVDLFSSLATAVISLKRRTGDPEASGRAFMLGHIDKLAPVRATDVAEHVGLDLSTVSRHLKALEDAGYVRRSPDPDDRRAALLELSETGRDLLESTTRARTALLAQVTADWPREDLTNLTRLLNRLARELENL